MASPTWQETGAASAQMVGQLTRDNVPSLWQQLQAWQPQVSQYEVCLKQLARVDSAGMVMLIHLIQHAKNQNCHIMLNFVPNQLMTLFELSNVDGLLSEHIQVTEN
ncbi:STAS domain-containing protein [Vibrio aphrogenes]|uniref:STAS domain-containing protein n=1 Tax=Vibrio aphrogenes TaxID=1891186 RepID=UPI000B34BF1F|nr:STAS domain-containing protein [Vibrio aphrogenes]